jgi:hypothetical protein
MLKYKNITKSPNNFGGMKQGELSSPKSESKMTTSPMLRNNMPEFSNYKTQDLR